MAQHTLAKLPPAPRCVRLSLAEGNAGLPREALAIPGESA